LVDFLKPPINTQTEGQTNDEKLLAEDKELALHVRTIQNLVKQFGYPQQHSQKLSQNLQSSPVFDSKVVLELASEIILQNLKNIEVPLPQNVDELMAGKLTSTFQEYVYSSCSWQVKKASKHQKKEENPEVFCSSKLVSLKYKSRELT